MEELFCAEETITIPAGADQVLVTGRLLRTAQFVGPEDVALLSVCTTPRSLKDHARVAATLFGAESAVIEQRLTELSQARLLISTADLKRVWTSQPTAAAASPGPIQCCIPTRARPAAVNRALQGFAANALAWQHKVRFIVSEDDEHESADVPSPIAGACVQYVTRQQRRQFARELANTTGIARALIEFGICGPDTEATRLGANRNALLLLSSGTRLVFLDDDVICELSEWHDADRRATFSGVQDPTKFVLCGSEVEARSQVRPVERDFFGSHAEYLGSEVLHAVSSAGFTTEYDSHLTPQWVRAALREPAVIISTSVGIVGDLAIDSPAPWLLQDEDARCRGSKVGGRYESRRLSRYGVRLASGVSIGRPVISHGFCMGLDTTRYVPPFVPVGRHEDCLFGTMVSILMPSACFCYLPVATLHRPIEHRAFPETALSQPAPMTTGGLFMALVSACKGDDVLPVAERPRCLGRQLSLIGRLPWDAFEEYIINAFRQQWAAELVDLDRIVSLHSDKDRSFWCRDMKAAIAVRKRCIEHGTLPAISDDPRLGWDSQHERSRLQEVVRMFGELIEAWDVILKAASRCSAVEAAAVGDRT